MNPTLSELYHQHVASTFDKQMHLSDTIGRRNWEFDMNRGLLSFGKDLQWEAQILGTVAEESQTWLWAWANEASGIPPELLKVACSMRELGTREGIAELTNAEISLDEVDGHYLAMVATGVLDAEAYYRGPYPGGAVFLLISDKSFIRCRSNPVRRILINFPQVISTYSIEDHRKAFEGYLHYYGFAPQSRNSQIVLEQDGKTVLTATFDALNRLAGLEGNVSPTEEDRLPHKKPWWKV